MTLAQLRSQLSAIEPDDSTYSGIDSSDIVLLEQLVQDQEAWMAARAIVALSKVPDAKAVGILSRAASDPRREVRVAVATSASNLNPKDGTDILIKLLDDREIGVRKFAVRSVSGAHDRALHSKLSDIEIHDPAPRIREVAKEKLRELNLRVP